MHLKISTKIAEGEISGVGYGKIPVSNTAYFTFKFQANFPYSTKFLFLNFVASLLSTTPS
ncbi:hypothetical protein GO755_13290 [Spirosoma sp. HMF4905]|uniref:Uncharacterized protein n=1 Tax=Spirosoma arboris TaxID=2682092 RepID=A0A7K1SBG5_9BACT|nr:hypothetical protein [Spirosoma arboris]MVM31008.1 hypothetical protein [Spirosoma arboris]